MSSYEFYGKVSQSINDSTLVSGRCNIQKYAEPLIIQDVISKLEIGREDRVLEIGCGLGTILLPLAFIAKKVYGIDHPDIISRLKQQPINANCCLIAGNWLKDEFSIADISKIIIYSVLHYMNSAEEAFQFIEKALSYLPSGGRVLIGDIPNEDKKRRFNVSEKGILFNQEWEKQKSKFITSDERAINEIALLYKSEMESEIKPSDEMVFSIMRHFRELGHETYLLPQLGCLPFGNTREDILIIKA